MPKPQSISISTAKRVNIFTNNRNIFTASTRRIFALWRLGEVDARVSSEIEQVEIAAAVHLHLIQQIACRRPAGLPSAKGESVALVVVWVRYRNHQLVTQPRDIRQAAIQLTSLPTERPKYNRGR